MDMILNYFQLIIIYLQQSLNPKMVVTTFITFLFILPLTHSQYLYESYRECRDDLFTCGETIQEVGFPFWGYNRPRNCGLADFFLTCHEDTYTTITINEQVYRILQINESTRSMKLALNGLIKNICLPYRNSGLGDSLFSYRPSYRNLTLFYTCSDLSNIPVRQTFSCENEPDRSFLFLPNQSRVEELSGCNIDYSTTVPVGIKGFEEFEENQNLGILEVLNLGFDIEYQFDYTSCSVCNTSGGVCWTNTTSSVEPPTCLCPNGRIQHHFCTKSEEGFRHSLKMTVGFGAGGAFTVFVCLFILCRCCTWKSPSRPPYFWKMETKMDRNVEDFIRQHGSHYPKRYSYSDIKKITNSFKDKLGKGGYGSVYKGKLSDGRLVAVKILNASKGNGEEFINEVASIGRTSHINVVSLFGFCYSGERRALVYEYMSNGSLDKLLNNRDNHLNSEKLFQISLGVARGLEYLHRGCNTRILHFDIKPHNILLDKDFCPKIADFGLAKTYCGNESIVSMAELRGTIGYIAPEVFSRNFGNVSHKSDVYSYGMLLIEMVGGKCNDNAVKNANNSSEIYFPTWIYKRLELNEDVGLEGVMVFEESETSKKMLIVGLWCIQMDPMQRPPMNKVIDMLLGSLEDLHIPPKPFFSSPPQLPPVLYSSASGSTSYQ